MPPGTFYNYYGNKEDIFSIALTRLLEQVRAGTSHARKAGGTTEERLNRLRQALALSLHNAEELNALYNAGRVPLDEVLRACLVAMDYEDHTEQARIASGTAAVQLYRTLGGGWGPGAATKG